MSHDRPPAPGPGAGEPELAQAAGAATESAAREETVAGAELLEMFLQEPDKRPMQYAIITTCVLFTVLFLMTFPKGRAIEVPPVVIYVADLQDFVPQVKEPETRERIEVEDVKRVALPDPTPEEPEPIREPLPPPELEPLPPDAVIRRGLPHGPPRGQPIREGTTGLTPPQRTRGNDPEYPEIARRAGVGGTVRLSVVVDRTGRVGSIELITGIGRFGLDEAAIEAVKGWVYEPGRLEGRPVDVLMRVNINYTVR